MILVTLLALTFTAINAQKVVLPDVYYLNYPVDNIFSDPIEGQWRQTSKLEKVSHTSFNCQYSPSGIKISKNDEDYVSYDFCVDPAESGIVPHRFDQLVKSQQDLRGFCFVGATEREVNDEGITSYDQWNLLDRIRGPRWIFCKSSKDYEYTVKEWDEGEDEVVIKGEDGGEDKTFKLAKGGSPCSLRWNYKFDNGTLRSTSHACLPFKEGSLPLLDGVNDDMIKREKKDVNSFWCWTGKGANGEIMEYYDVTNSEDPSNYQWGFCDKNDVFFEDTN